MSNTSELVEILRRVANDKFKNINLLSKNNGKTEDIYNQFNKHCEIYEKSFLHHIYLLHKCELTTYLNDEIVLQIFIKWFEDHELPYVKKKNINKMIDEFCLTYIYLCENPILSQILMKCYENEVVDMVFDNIENQELLEIINNNMVVDKNLQSKDEYIFQKLNKLSFDDDFKYFNLKKYFKNKISEKQKNASTKTIDIHENYKKAQMVISILNCGYSIVDLDLLSKNSIELRQFYYSLKECTISENEKIQVYSEFISLLEDNIVDENKEFFINNISNNLFQSVVYYLNHKKI
jgi:hypothetical protein